MVAYLLEEPSLSENPSIRRTYSRNGLPLSFLSLAALDLPARRCGIRISFTVTTGDGSLPGALKGIFLRSFRDACKTVFTIHNLAHQGFFP